MCLKKNNGQSTLEYVIILAVVVGVIVAVGGIFNSQARTAYQTIYQK